MQKAPDRGPSANRAPSTVRGLLYSAALAWNPTAVDSLGSRIVLIDGKHLARLLIHYNVGTRDEEILRIKKLDEDFFE